MWLDPRRWTRHALNLNRIYGTAAMTHAFNQSQRLNRLPFTRGPNGVTATAPANANLAPPGHYMLFLVGTNGAPSVARIVHVGMPWWRTDEASAGPFRSSSGRLPEGKRPELFADAACYWLPTIAVNVAPPLILIAPPWQRSGTVVEPW